MDVFSPYLSRDRLHALADGRDLPSASTGAALFADISGFTPLTEFLAQAFGRRRGAEELSQYLNRVYGGLIEVVHGRGGSVVAFAGDAITCWFDQDDGRQAVACGLAMQRAMQEWSAIRLPDGGCVALALKIGVASGPARRFAVGDAAIQWLDVLAGDTLDRMAGAEHLAGQGEILVDGATALALGDLLAVREWRESAGVRAAVAAGLSAPPDPRPWPDLGAGSPAADQLQTWLLKPIVERLNHGHTSLLTELRLAVACFIRFAGIDYNDPAAGEQLDRSITWIQQTLQRYGGSLLDVNIGDKGSYLYAAFGAPIAHENDVQLALLAAAALRHPPAGLGCDLTLAIGMSQGIMRVGAYGGAQRCTYGVLGDEVNSAARLMQHAAPGEIIVSGQLQRAAATLGEWQPLPPLQLKGKRQPTPIFRLGGVRSDPGLNLERQAAALVGRQDEQDRLRAALDAACQGRGQIIGITGEAGIGKSRLVAEAVGWAGERGMACYGGGCHAHGVNSPYLVWQAIWPALLGLTPGLGGQEQIDELAERLAAIDPLLVERLPLLGPLLQRVIAEPGITRSMDAKLRKQALEALLATALRARAGQRPLALVLEDCHWLDELSHDLLEALALAIADLPVLIITTYRPLQLERLKALRIAALGYFQELELGPLAPAEVEQFLANQLDRPAGADAIVAAVIQRARGNPLYLAALTAELNLQPGGADAAAALAQLDVPQGIERLILSRIDRLPGQQYHALKVSSVVGRSFQAEWVWSAMPDLGVLDAVRGALGQLEQAQLLEYRPLDLSDYAFSHELIREVAYATLPYALRAQLHGRFADYLAAAHEGAEDRVLDMLAYHYARSEDRPKKRAYLQRAAAAAAAAYANEAAIGYYAQLLDLLADDERAAVSRQIGKLQERIGRWEQAQRCYCDALDQAIQADDHGEIARCQLALGVLARQQADYGPALEWLKLAGAGFADQPAELAQVMGEQGMVFYRQGRHAEAEAVLAGALELAESISDQAGAARALNNLGLVARDRGDYARAQGLYERSLAIQRRREDRVGEALSLNNLGLVARDRGDYARAQDLYERSLAIQQALGNQWGIALALNNLGSVAFNQGALGRTQALIEASLEIQRRLGDKWGACLSLYNLGTLALGQGRHRTAWRLCHESLGLAWAIGDRLSSIYGLVALAAAALELDGHGAPAEQIAAALAAAEVQLDGAGGEWEAEERPIFEGACAKARLRLGAARFEQAWRRGETDAWEATVALALAWRDRVPASYPPPAMRRHAAAHARA